MDVLHLVNEKLDFAFHNVGIGRRVEMVSFIKNSLVIGCSLTYNKNVIFRTQNSGLIQHKI